MTTIQTCKTAAFCLALVLSAPVAAQARAHAWCYGPPSHLSFHEVELCNEELEKDLDDINARAADIEARNAARAAANRPPALDKNGTPIFAAPAAKPKPCPPGHPWWCHEPRVAK